MSRVLYVPILHAEQEASVIQGSGQKAESAVALIKMWAGIEQKLNALNLEWAKIRIYQEALPVCGKEAKIVDDLAAKGSQNHRLIRNLIKKGAQLEGTENPELLVREYDLLSRVFQRSDSKQAFEEYREASEKILEARDQFVFKRIAETLVGGETCLLFVGVRHKVDQLLKINHEVTYVIHRIPFETVKAVYNI